MADDEQLWYEGEEWGFHRWACGGCPDPCDSLKPWRCVRPGSPWYWEPRDED